MSSPFLTIAHPNDVDLESASTSKPQTDFQPKQVEQLYLKHCMDIERFLNARTQSKELVETILQDIYLKLMALPDLSVIQHPKAYLIRLASNLLIDYHRQQKRNSRLFIEQPVDEVDIKDNSASLPEQIHYQQLIVDYLKQTNGHVKLLAKLR